MAWMAQQNLPPVHNTFASLCNRNGDTLTINNDCLGILEGIYHKLMSEDSTLRTFRRAIGFGQNIRKDLIPLLHFVRDDTANIFGATKIIDMIIKILVNLTVPVEYLLSMEDIAGSDVGKHTIFEVNRLLMTSKEAFVDGKSTKAVVDHIKYFVEQDKELDMEQCNSINNCLLLLRNILHIPEAKPASNAAPTSMQNQIVWNLFTQSIDKIIIYLMSSPKKIYWGVTMVQLIALIYKDQHVGTLQKLLNLWLEASFSESSDDNESNTSPPNQGSGDSSPVITSDPTSDSSDNSSETNKIRNKTLSNMKRVKSTETETSSSSGVSSMGQSAEGPNLEPTKTPESEISDCGYVTQVENQENISTSSNDDDCHEKPVHQKPHTFQKMRFNHQIKPRPISVQENKELRRKKLVKRSKTNTIKMKGLMHHLPTDEDVANILKEFTVDFLLKGYSSLVEDLHSQLLTNVHIQIDTSHFFWLVTYFLKFATQLELDLEHVSPVFSYEILSYLVFQGVWTYEELEILCRIPNMDLKPCLRRLHLVVTAIREFLQGIESYQKMMHLSEEDRKTLKELKLKIGQTEELGSLFVLLFRQYNVHVQSRQYLQDLILTNHNYLLFLDNSNQLNIVEHLTQFATVEIMRQYGILLESFKDNGEYVNNCIFTMMHHIGGDLKHVSTLFQPSILKTFSQIWETDYEICDDWSDLIEYVIHKFINTPRSTTSDQVPVAVCPQIILETQNLESLHLTSQSNKTQPAIIRELLKQNIINENHLHEMDEEFNKNDSIIPINSSMETNHNTSSEGDIQVLKDYFYKEKKSKMLLWLQQVLLETCYVKLSLAQDELCKNNVMWPTAYYFVLLNLPVPVVPWTLEQTDILTDQPFVLLLHKLGFYLPVDTGKMFVRIPSFWNAEYVFSIALQLGPIDPAKLKFDVGKLRGTKTLSNNFQNEKSMDNEEEENSRFSRFGKQAPAMMRYTPLPNSSQWCKDLQGVKPRKDVVLQRTPASSTGDMMDCSPIHEREHNASPVGSDRNSACDTASIASDLTRMCVSDEEDKLTLSIHENA